MVGESEVIFWQATQWHGKRYCPSGRVLAPLAPGPLVEDERVLQGKVFDDNGFPVIQPESLVAPRAVPADKAEKEAQLSKPKPEVPAFFNYQDYIPLPKALAKQRDKPPKRSYFHATSLRPVTMGEWMLGNDPRYRAAAALRGDSAWRKRAYQAVRMAVLLSQVNFRVYFLLLHCFKLLAYLRVFDCWQELQEFEDIDDRERDFLQNWNAAIQAQHLVTDLDTALICRKVLQLGDVPERAWTAHLLNLWEERQLGREDMLILMQEFHEQQRARAALMGNTDEEDTG